MIGGARRFTFANTGAAILVAVSTAAAAADKVVVPTISMPAAYEHEEARRGIVAPAALDRWWLRFGDAQLDALEDEAMRNGPDALTAAARIVEATQTRKAQTAQTLPSGSIAGTASRQHAYDLGGDTQNIAPISGNTDQLGANFNVSWELDLFEVVKTERRIAAADAAQARFDIEGTRASLAAAVADTYFQIKGLAIQLADARETVRIQNNLLDIARKRAHAGAGPEDEIDRVASGVSQATAQADDLDAQMQAARRQLLILVGRGLAPDGDLAVSGDPPAVPPRPRPCRPSSSLAVPTCVRPSSACARRSARRGCGIWPCFRPSPCCRRWGSPTRPRPGIRSFRRTPSFPPKSPPTRVSGLWRRV